MPDDGKQSISPLQVQEFPAAGSTIIRTFRAADGLWEELGLKMWPRRKDSPVIPGLVQTFYNARRQQLQQPEIHTRRGARKQKPLKAIAFAGDAKSSDNLHERARATTNIIPYT